MPVTTTGTNVLRFITDSFQWQYASRPASEPRVRTPKCMVTSFQNERLKPVSFVYGYACAARTQIHGEKRYMMRLCSSSSSSIEPLTLCKYVNKNSFYESVLFNSSWIRWTVPLSVLSEILCTR